MKKNLEMKRSRVVEEFRADIIQLYRNAAKCQHSHETIMAKVNAIRLRSEFKKLPLYHQARIEGCNDTMVVLHYYDVLKWTVVLDGVRLEGRDPQLEGRYCEINPDLSCYCYVTDGKFLPFCEKDRKKLTPLVSNESVS